MMLARLRLPVLLALAALAPIAALAWAQTKPAPLSLQIDAATTLSLAPIPAGKFTMGSPVSENGHTNDEADYKSELHTVTISKAFYLGVSEVTQAQYQAVMAANPSVFKGADLPVDNVALADAIDFCKKLSEKTGRVVRLPTEAEWEYACRAGSTTRFAHGDDEAALTDYAWFGVNAGGKTHPVMQKKPNAFGLYDMQGNVWEWTATNYFRPLVNKDETDRAGPAGGTLRVLRGGSWDNHAYSLRSANRGALKATTHHERLGFRVLVEAN